MEVNENAVPVKSENDLTKKKNNKGIIIGIILAAVIAFVIGIIIYNSSDNAISEQLDLGQKYLEEQDYELAIVAFSKAIEIDDKCPEAYVGLAETYIRMGEYDKALETAKKGYEITGDENLAEYMEMLESGNVSRSDGKIMKTTVYDGNGVVLFYHEFTYDKQGRQASVTHYNSEHVFVSSLDFPYDTMGNQLVSYHYHGNDGSLVKVEHIYENGLLISEKWHGDDACDVTYEYDEKGRKIKQIRKYLEDKQRVMYELYQYDENDNIIRTDRYSNDGLLYYSIVEYQNNKRYKMSEYDGDGNLRRYIIYKDDGWDEYDGSGNLTETHKNS